MLIQENVLLAPLTTLRIGGPARFFATATNPAELVEAVQFAGAHHLPIVILGGGSNLLVTDAGFNGLVIHNVLSSLPPITTIPQQNPLSIVASVAAGTDWDEFVLAICQLNFSGVECLAGIPGLIGGSPIQNIGAYGQEVAQTIHSVTALDLESLEFVTLPHEACGFAYRTSIFNTTHRDRYIVAAVTFRFDPTSRPALTYPDLQRHFAENPNPTPMDIYHAVRAIRATKGMLIDATAPDDPDTRSAGSFFKNPIVPLETLARIALALNLEEAKVPNWPTGQGTTKLPAAWIVERAGFHKGFALGPAGISSKHTLAIINRTGAATFADVAALRDAVRAEVLSRFSITLEQEPIQVGSLIGRAE
ncbi:UDP-N-acetylmuramate dehydrogenase [Granulicella arctica]|uniref:UDP-N-acetylmuramate dehydrogenase n=1 Tax=Granulicella arctica TaxID=940613 RepID=UPI0021E04777|nr:UDP-N-acetylmuramate dehydrogenase [Granulicella arctica]